MEKNPFEESHQPPQLIQSWRLFCWDWNYEEFRNVVSQYYELGTLVRLLSFEDVEVRRAASFAISKLGDYSVNRYLAQALHDTDPMVCQFAESGLRRIWLCDGTESQRAALQDLAQANKDRCYTEAYRMASQFVKTTPNVAEAWNQRAIASFALGNVLPTIHDCREALMRNPVHFSAAAGMGHIWEMIGNKARAIRAFQYTLQIHPNHTSAHESLERLQGSRKEG